MKSRQITLRSLQNTSLTNVNETISDYRCPLCAEPLTVNDHTARCDNNHSFDRAKEGYFNLLPVHKKNSKLPGDNPDMVMARRRFLSSGFYQPLRNMIIEQIKQHTVAHDISLSYLIDIGCGEGYYTDGLQQAFELNHCHGIDIAKKAVKVAAKKFPAIHFAVASNADLPFSDHTFDIAVKIFAPAPADEVKRVLSPGGLLFSINPAEDHLIELKSAIYRTPKRHEQEVSPEGFSPIAMTRKTWTVELTQTDLQDLIQMTPFAWKISDEAQQALDKGFKDGVFSMTLDFWIGVWKR